jgi:superfamily II DNA or RNA helicase
MATQQMHPGDRVRVRGEQWQIERCLPYPAAAIVDVRGCDRANRGERARFLLPFEPVDRITHDGRPRILSPAAWRRAARRALAQAAPPPPALAAASRASVDVIPFQLEPALALLHGDASRFLLADAVGMGKTVQAGLMLAEWLLRYPDHRALIVTPAGLRDQWCAELRDRFGLDAELLDAAGVARTSSALPASVNPWSVHRLVLTSIDYVKRPEVMRSLEPLLWDLIVFDEAHALTGRSDRAAAARAVAERARAVVMLTATPHGGDEDAFQRLCNIGRLDGDRPLAVFRRTRADAGLEPSRRTVMLRVAPTAAESAMHRALLDYARLVWTTRDQAAGARLAMAVLLRRASSSASSLARSLERRLALLDRREPTAGVQPTLPFGGPADDEEPDGVLGVPGLPDSVDERARLHRVLVLAREASTCESKLRVLRRFLSRTREAAIVFTEYRDTLRRLASEVGVSAVELHGGLTSRERAEAISIFAAGGARLLLATDAASEGLNLHYRCRLVINLELPWMPLRLEQRIGRVDRIGQRQRVHAVQLIAAGTSEEAVLTRLVTRLSRVEDATRLLGRTPGETDLAAAVLTDTELPQAERLADGGLRLLDLREEAALEAARIVITRRLWPGTDGRPPEPGPFAARIRRNRARWTPTANRYWLFRLLLVDEDGRPADELSIAIGATGTRLAGRAAAITRGLLDPAQPGIQQALRVQVSEFLERASRLGEARDALWMQRERAIRARLQQRQSRLAAALLQPGLFEAGRQRIAAAQAQMLADAVVASSVRLTEIAARRRLHADGCDLVLAVSLE